MRLQCNLIFCGGWYLRNIILPRISWWCRQGPKGVIFSLTPVSIWRSSRCLTSWWRHQDVCGHDHLDHRQDIWGWQSRRSFLRCISLCWWGWISSSGFFKMRMIFPNIRYLINIILASKYHPTLMCWWHHLDMRRYVVWAWSGGSFLRDMLLTSSWFSNIRVIFYIMLLPTRGYFTLGGYFISGWHSISG